MNTRQMNIKKQKFLHSMTSQTIPNHYKLIVISVNIRFCEKKKPVGEPITHIQMKINPKQTKPIQLKLLNSTEREKKTYHFEIDSLKGIDKKRLISILADIINITTSLVFCSKIQILQIKKFGIFFCSATNSSVFRGIFVVVT